MKTLLLTIDFMNDIVHPDFNGAAADMVSQCHTLSHANEAIAQARARGDIIAHCRVGFASDYSDCPESSPLFTGAKAHGKLQLGTPSCDWHPDLDVQDTDLQFTKQRVNPFCTAALAQLLTDENIGHVKLCGVSTPMAIAAAAHWLHDHDMPFEIIENACAARNQVQHQATVEALDALNTRL
jgi:nicotinamidase-related amidase